MVFKGPPNFGLRSRPGPYWPITPVSGPVGPVFPFPPVDCYSLYIYYYIYIYFFFFFFFFLILTTISWMSSKLKIVWYIFNLKERWLD